MASKCKRYYWLKLKQDFFTDPRIKKLRRIAGGDTYTVIFLKIMLLTIKTNGVLVFEGIENTLAMELALKLDEDEKNVEATLIYMQSMGLLVDLEHNKFDIPQVRELTGSETDAAERKRRQRKREKEAKCVTLSHQSHTQVTSGHKTVPTEIETEKELEIESDTQTESDPLFEQWLYEYSASATNPPAYQAMMRKKFREGNEDALEAFATWKRAYLKNKRQEEAKRKIEEFDYAQLMGMRLGGRIINRVVDTGSMLHLFFDDGTDALNYKQDLYQWIHQKHNEAINQ